MAGRARAVTGRPRTSHVAAVAGARPHARLSAGVAAGSGLLARAGAARRRLRRRRHRPGRALRGHLRAAGHQNLMELEPPWLWHTLTASHPMPAERIATARA